MHVRRSKVFGSLTVLSVTALLVLGAEACSSDSADGDAGANGAASGAGAAGGGTSVGGGPSAGGSGGADTCTVSDTTACGQCMDATCCEAYVACEADDLCWACVTGTDGDACAANAASHDKATAYLECYGGPCNADCIGSAGECTEASEVYAEECGACLETSCCEELGACFAHQGCWVDCVTDHNAAGCHEPSAHALFYALGQCAQTSCNEACISGPDVTLACEDIPAEAPSAGSCVTLGGNVACNPVTNEGCSVPGEACDAAQGGAFSCYPAPNDQPLCTPCGESEGWCAPGHMCVGGECARYCCTDADCGSSGAVCDVEATGLTAGICVVP